MKKGTEKVGRRAKKDPAGILMTPSENGENGDTPKRLAPAPDAATKSFDLGTRRAQKIAEMTLYDPEYPGAFIDTGIRIGVRSVYTDEVKKAASQAAEGKDIAVDVENGRVVGSDEALEENIFEQTIASVAYWRNEGETDPRFQNALNFNGEPFPCTPENVRKLFTDEETAWIQKPVERFYLNFRNFFSGPKSKSPSPRASASV